MSDEIPLFNFRFEVNINVSNGEQFGLTNPLCNAGFSECDGLEMTMEPKIVREGGNNTQQLRLVGPVSYGTLSLKRGMTPTLDVWKWFSAATSNTGRGTTANITILVKDTEGNPQIRYVLSDCLPLKLKAPGLNGLNAAIAIEDMQIAYSRFTVEAVNSAGNGPAGSAGIGFSASASLSASGTVSASASFSLG